MSPPPRIVVYTALFADRDPLREPDGVASGVDYICFTDRSELRSKTWQVRVVAPPHADPVRSARHFKVLSHRYLGDYDWVLWADATLQPKSSVGEWIQSIGPRASLAVHRHRFRSCPYDEAIYCARTRRDLGPVLRAQTARYERAGFPHNGGLHETTLLFRRHSAEVEYLNEWWWTEIQQGSRRDQVSLPFVLWDLGVTVHALPWSVDTNPHFHWHPHRYAPLSNYWRTWIRHWAERAKNALSRPIGLET